MQGIIVALGDIDADFEGEIKMTTHSPSGVSVVKSRSEACTVNFTSCCANQKSD